MSLLVSIIVPCYNQAIYLSEALESVLSQTYSLWECIIVNDGSPDNTEQIASAYCKRDQRIKYFLKANGGLSSARNFGIAHSTGQLILPLDADDAIGIDYLIDAVNKFQDNKQLVVVYPHAEYFGQRTGRWDVRYKGYRHLLLTNSIFCSAVFTRVDFDRVGGYDENMKLGFEDWEFWIRLLSEEAQVIEIPKVQFFYRIKENSMVFSLVKSAKKEATAINYVVYKHFDKYAETFGGLTHYIREHGEMKERLSVIRSNFFSKALYFLSRKIAGLP